MCIILTDSQVNLIFDVVYEETPEVDEVEEQ